MRPIDKIYRKESRLFDCNRQPVKAFKGADKPDMPDSAFNKEVISMKQQQKKHTIRVDLETVAAIKAASFGMGLPQGAILRALFNGDKSKAAEFLAQVRERTERLLEMNNGQPRH